MKIVKRSLVKSITKTIKGAYDDLIMFYGIRETNYLMKGAN